MTTPDSPELAAHPLPSGPDLAALEARLTAIREMPSLAAYDELATDAIAVAALRSLDRPDVGLREALWSLHTVDHEDDEEWCSADQLLWPCPTADLLYRMLGPSTPVTREDGAPSRGPSLGQPEGYMEDAPRLPVESQARVGIAQQIQEVMELIELGENRAMATDGPVPHFRGELDDPEWRRLWVALGKVRAALAAADNQSPEPARDGLRRNVLIHDDHGFKGEWVAVPREDFDAARAIVQARLSDLADAIDKFLAALSPTTETTK